MQKTGVLLAALFAVLLAVPARAQTPAPSPAAAVWKFDNPFCEVRAALVPVDSAIAGTKYLVDAEAPITCPSYVHLSGSGPTEDAISAAGATNVTAIFLQKLPDLLVGEIDMRVDYTGQ